MIQEFVTRFDAKREWLRAKLAEAHPKNYVDIVKMVIEAIQPDTANILDPDPDRIHQIDDGNYSGTLVFVIAEKGYQPSRYYYVKVAYGSCSGCDTLQMIHAYPSPDGKPTPKQVDKYFTLALHILQGLKAMEDE